MPVRYLSTSLQADLESRHSGRVAAELHWAEGHLAEGAVSWKTKNYLSVHFRAK